MTTQQKLEDTLSKNGMFDTQIKEVMLIAKAAISKQIEKVDYRITWDRPSSEYDDVIHTMLFVKTKPFVYKWYQENLPNAWNKDLFL